MIYTAQELKAKFGNYQRINKALTDGKYIKLSHGLYADSDPNLSELEALFMRYPNAVLTMQSAFSFYGLSDYVPDKYYVATAQNAHVINNAKVKQIFISNEIFVFGKETIKTQYGTINIYDKERLLIELFRLKTKIDYPLYKEVVNSYRKLMANHELDNHKIVKYCSLFKNGASLRKQIYEIIV